MAFLESPRFPTGIRFGASGGPEFSTQIITVNSGNEQRNSVWSVSRGRWQLDVGPYDQATIDLLIDLFRTAKGRANGFRFRDPSDWQDRGRGKLGAGVGTGLPTYQLTKVYPAGSASDSRPIRKPVAGTIALQRNGSTVVFGPGAGQAALDATTGVVTFVADASASVSSITPGSTTSVTLSSAVGVVSGGKLYLSGISGTLGAALNGQAWPVSSVSGAVYTLAVATSALTGSGGTGAKYPQPTDTLAYTGQHDTPVRFDTDSLAVTAVDKGYYAVQGATLVEIRT